MSMKAIICQRPHHASSDEKLIKYRGSKTGCGGHLPAVMQAADTQSGYIKHPDDYLPGAFLGTL